VIFILRHYRIGGKEIVFLNNLPSGVNLDMEINLPSYISWAGYNGWCNTIQEHYPNLSPGHIEIMMLWPDRDPAPILKMDSEVLENLDINPFMNKCSLEDFINWYYKYRFINYYEFSNELELINTIEPSSRHEFYSAKFMFNNFEHTNKFKILNCMKRPWYEISALSIEGVIRSSVSKLFKTIGIDNTRYLFESLNMDNTFITKEIIINVAKRINYKYFNSCNLYIEDLMAAGVPTKYLFPDKIVSGLSKKQVRSLANYMVNNHTSESIDAITLCDLNQGLNSILCLHLSYDILYHIRENSIVLLKWASRHREQLNRNILVHDKDGGMITVYGRQLLDYITESMLVNGERTSFKIVLKNINDDIDRMIKLQLGKDINLPSLKLKPINGVKAITTSSGLKFEGKKMNHCIGSYINACVKKNAFIFHLGDPAPYGATINLVPKYNKFIVDGFYGCDNKVPGDKELIILKDKLLLAANASTVKMGGR